MDLVRTAGGSVDSRAPLELGRGARLVLPPQVVIDLSDVTLIGER